jgi:hypothetical protein
LFGSNAVLCAPIQYPPGVAHQQPKRGRLWLADGCCIRLRPEHRNYVWSYEDFVEGRTHDGRKYRMLNVLDEFSHECLAIRVAHKLKAIDVAEKSAKRYSALFRVVGAFPDGESALNLAAARLRHVAGSRWSMRR